MDVNLFVYDLSKGLARQFSRQFLGTQIDAVYHTSIVLEGIEYFFGAGVQTAYAGSTHHGQPMEKVKLGRTDLPIEIVLEYLESLKQIYTAESYDLFLHNCNNFSNDFAMFLVGKGIPDHITSLPRRVLDTPFGQMLKPQLDAAMRPITQAPVPPQRLPQPSAASNGFAFSGKPTPGKVHNITKQADLTSLLNSAENSCAVVFYTSSTCAPCKICYPAYDNLAAEAGEKAVLIKVDINYAQEIASNSGVRATPTFVTYLKGKKEEEWPGADPARLLGTVRLLILSAHPPHPHEDLRLSNLLKTSRKPITYTKMPPLDKVVAKLGPLGKDPIVSAMKTFIEAIHGSPSQESPLPSLPAFASFLQKSIETLPSTDLFAAYDLFRLAVADPRIGAFFAEEKDTATILGLLNHVHKLGVKAPYNLRIVSLHVSCNLFASPLASHVIISNSTLAKSLIELVTASLLDEAHLNVRIASASLAFNLATANFKARVDKKEDAISSSEQVELVAGMLEAIGREEESKDVITGLVRALGFLAYRAEIGGEVLDLCKALEAGKTVLAQEKLSGDDSVLKEVGSEIFGKGLK
ncbi:thioredoxin [Tothia fuscella]|uniref:Thioredoxin n=1 Tax=Tothia fuscella TaxID=1048955 RepID=A0A9P4TVS2_9PEZI|nr:thioredoxin [Tothia fuscella]